MTPGQIEKAAEELKSIAERYVWFNDYGCCGIENSALPDIESFLTRFSQQCEADALERAAVEVGKYINHSSEAFQDLDTMEHCRAIRSLKPKAQ